MVKPIHVGPDLLDLLASEEQEAKMKQEAERTAHLCRCGNTGVSGGGWTLDVASGKWVHGDPRCRKPRY